MEHGVSSNTAGIHGSIPALDFPSPSRVLLSLKSQSVSSLSLSIRFTGATVVLTALLSGCNNPSGQSESPVTQTGETTEHSEFLSAFAAQHGLGDDLPEVEVVRTVTPSESKQVVDECVADQGWAQLPDGTFQYPTEQDRSFALAMYTCYASYPVDEAYAEPLSEAQWDAVYSYWVEETLPCLSAEGYDVPEPPSRETFLSNPTWSPDTPEVRAQVSNRVATGELISHEYVFTDVCPVSPPDDIRKGYGG